MKKSEFNKFVSDDIVLDYFKRNGADIGYNVNELCKVFGLKQSTMWKKLENLVALGKLTKTEYKGRKVGYYLPEKESEIYK